MANERFLCQAVIGEGMTGDSLLGDVHLLWFFWQRLGGFDGVADMI
jgi:hypothetical protein